MNEKLDAQRKAEFKEVAREIINKDRYARSVGTSQNTIGAIERALVKAFLRGRSCGRLTVSETSPAKFLEWILIPPRGRQTLASLLPFDPFTGVSGEAAMLKRVISDGTVRWQQICGRTGNPMHDDHVIAAGSVDPLIKLSLLIAKNEESSILGLTELGIQTVLIYNARSFRRDLTLPKIGFARSRPRKG